MVRISNQTDVEWHLVLNDTYFGDVDDNDDTAIAADHKWFDGLTAQEQNRVKRESWNHIFEPTHCPWEFVQATFWELRQEQIIRVIKFIG